MTEENTNTELNAQGLTIEDSANEEAENNNVELGNEDKQNADAEGEGQEDKQTEDKQKEDVNEFVGIPEGGYKADSIKLPEGMELDNDMLGEFNTFAKNVNMSQKAYEQSINYGTKLVQNTQAKMLEAFKQQNEARITGYQRDAYNDKEIGGNNYDDSLTTAIIGYKYYVKNVDSELDKYMQESGLQYNKSFIKLFKYIGSQMQDDKMPDSKGQAKQKTNKAEDVANRMFPTMNGDKK